MAIKKKVKKHYLEIETDESLWRKFETIRKRDGFSTRRAAFIAMMRNAVCYSRIPKPR